MGSIGLKQRIESRFGEIRNGFRKSFVRFSEEEGIYKATWLGHTWYIPVKDPGIAMWAFDFIRVQDRHEELIQRNDVVIDVGACSGEYTIAAARRCSRVYAFEPDPRLFRCLQKNIEESALRNVTATNCAVADAVARQRPFYDIPGTIAGGSMYYRHAVRGFVDTTTLDDFFSDHEEPVGVLKIAVNGLEPRVVAGGRSVVARTRHIVFQSAKHEDTVEALKGQGFRVAVSRPRGTDPEGRDVRVVRMDRGDVVRVRAP